MNFSSKLMLALLDGTVTAAVLALTSIGLSLQFGVMRIVNIAHGAFFMLGAVLAFAISTQFPQAPALGFLVAIIAAPIMVGILAFLSERIVLRRLKWAPDSTIVATIGLLYIFQQAALSFFGPTARPVVAPFRYTIDFSQLGFDSISFGYSAYKLSIVVPAVLVLILLGLVIRYSKIGLIMRATQYDSETARAFAVNTNLVYAWVFALGAALAAFASVLIVPVSQAYYLMGDTPLLMSFIVVIIGGLGSLRGTLVASLLIGLSDGIVTLFFAPTLAKMIGTILVALLLVIRPSGLFKAGGA
ncbi:MAG: branched-chain amino acid ABC transporter permease [Candidatus Symbiobacter sp.]|nr:branched-chain amino acid ABC transporter permease [Candidatus Symbiobacter sp.]